MRHLFFSSNPLYPCLCIQGQEILGMVINDSVMCWKVLWSMTPWIKLVLSLCLHPTCVKCWWVVVQLWCSDFCLRSQGFQQGLTSTRGKFQPCDLILLRWKWNVPGSPDQTACRKIPIPFAPRVRIRSSFPLAFLPYEPKSVTDRQTHVTPF